MFAHYEILLALIAYLTIIFCVAYFFERYKSKVISKALSPYIYALSLAVYCTSWTFYGSVGRAATSGLSFLTIYIGPTLMTLLFPIFLTKVIRISKDNGITSISDFLSLRYGRSMLLSRIVTLIAVAGITPYIGLQIKAVITTIGLISDKHTSLVYGNWTGLVITLILGIFAVVFGARRIDPTERHTGLVYAIAFESVVKLIAFLSVGFFVSFYLFNGFADIFEGIKKADLSHLLEIGGSGASAYSEWSVLLLLSMSAIILLPRQFQMAVVENSSLEQVRTSLWLFPLYLLAINIFVVPIAFAGLLKGIDTGTADYFVLTLPFSEGFTYLTLFAFIGGFSAATAMVIVEAIALSTMVMNSFIMPLIVKLSDSPYLSNTILNIKRAVILIVIFLGYVFAVTFGRFFSLVDLGLKSFEAVSIFAPAFFLGLYWKRANKKGAIAGLLAGFAVWLYTLILPAFIKAELVNDISLLEGLISTDLLNPSGLFGLKGLGKWEHSFYWSMFINLMLLTGLSIMTKQSQEEKVQSLVFVESYKKTYSTEENFEGGAFSLADIENTLSLYIGQTEADKALQDYLHRKKLKRDRLKPSDLLRLRYQAEKVLSASIGPALASLIMEQRLVVTEGQRKQLSEEVRQMSEDLRLSRQELAEKNRELFSLKEFTEKIIESAPIGIATVDGDFNIKYWNRGMERITGTQREEAKSGKILSLLQWLRVEWFYSIPKRSGTIKIKNGKTLQYSINPLDYPLDGYVLILEDSTERKKMEEELLHSAKLASIGRLTAGLSHEIGNPIASISSLVQEIKSLDLNTEEEKVFTRQSLEAINNHIQRIAGIVQSLGKFARISSKEKIKTDIADLFDRALFLVKYDKRFKDVSVERNIQHASIAMVNPDQIQQLFLNLLLNALDAMPDGGRIRIDIFEDDGFICCKLSDSGVGISEADIERIYDPFFTTKPVGKGTGLGLSICYGIIKYHKGTITAESKKGTGTTFTIRLPVEDR